MLMLEVYNTRAALALHSRRLQFLHELHELAQGALLPHEIAERESEALQLIALALKDTRQNDDAEV